MFKLTQQRLETFLNITHGKKLIRGHQFSTTKNKGLALFLELLNANEQV